MKNAIAVLAAAALILLVAISLVPGLGFWESSEPARGESYGVWSGRALGLLFVLGGLVWWFDRRRHHD